MCHMYTIVHHNLEIRIKCALPKKEQQFFFSWANNSVSCSSSSVHVLWHAFACPHHAQWHLLHTGQWPCNCMSMCVCVCLRMKDVSAFCIHLLASLAFTFNFASKKKNKFWPVCSFACSLHNWRHIYRGFAVFFRILLADSLLFHRFGAFIKFWCTKILTMNHWQPSRPVSLKTQSFN